MNEYRNYTYNEMMPFNNAAFNNQYGYGYNQMQNMMPFTDNNSVNNSMTPNTNNSNDFTNTNLNLASTYEGYIRGNIFNNLYEQYKNYRPAQLSVANEQEEMLFNLNQLSFFTHDLRLYLDNYPNDKEMINLFNRYCQMANDALYNYEQQYGPITWQAPSNKNEFSWQSTTWPWEMEVM